MSAAPAVNWVRTGNFGMTAAGWMITRSGSGYMVFDDEARHVGTYATRDEAEEATR